MTILSILLVLLSFLVLIITTFYFKLHSPEYLTHDQFYMAMAGIGTAFFAGLLAVFIHVSNKLTDFAEDLGEIKGKLNYINGHSSTSRKRNRR